MKDGRNFWRVMIKYERRHSILGTNYLSKDHKIKRLKQTGIQDKTQMRKRIKYTNITAGHFLLCEVHLMCRCPTNYPISCTGIPPSPDFTHFVINK